MFRVYKTYSKTYEVESVHLYSNYGDIADRTFGTADDIDQRFQNRHNSLADGFALTRHIVKFMFTDVVVPFAGFVKEFLGVGEIERRGMTGVGRHRRRPGVLELNFRLWIVKTHGGRVTLNINAFDAEVAGAPHFVQYHLCVRCVQYFRDSSLGDPEDMILLVVGADAGHLFEGVFPVGIIDGHTTGADGFTAVNPQLTEVDRTTVEIGNVGNHQFPQLLPTGNLQPTTDNRIVAGDGETAVFWTEAKGLVKEIGAGSKVDGDIGSLTQTTHLTGVANGVSEGGVGRNMDVGSMNVQTADEENK